MGNYWMESNEMARKITSHFVQQTNFINDQMIQRCQNINYIKSHMPNINALPVHYQQQQPQQQELHQELQEHPQQQELQQKLQQEPQQQELQQQQPHKQQQQLQQQHQ